MDILVSSRDIHCRPGGQLAAAEPYNLQRRKVTGSFWPYRIRACLRIVHQCMMVSRLPRPESADKLTSPRDGNSVAAGHRRIATAAQFHGLPGGVKRPRSIQRALHCRPNVSGPSVGPMPTCRPCAIKEGQPACIPGSRGVSCVGGRTMCALPTTEHVACRALVRG